MRHEIRYGKARVPVYRRVVDDLFAAEVDVEVLGDAFLPAYTEGDNSMVVATDTMKNVVLREALTFEGATLDGFADHLARHFIATYDVMERVRVTVRELRFDAYTDVLYQRAYDDYGMAMREVDREGGEPRVCDYRAGRVDLELMKLRGSAFTHFARDENTTLPERADRPLFIHLDVHWRTGHPDDYIPSSDVAGHLRGVFHAFVSESIQHLVHEMGARLLEAHPEIAEVTFEARNLTRDPYAVSDSDATHVVYSDPFPAYGTIALTLRREG